MGNYDPITNRMLMIEKYERAFGINDPVNSSPVTLTTGNEVTDLYTDSLLEKAYTKLINVRAPELTGMSVKEILDLPSWKVRTLMRALGNSEIIKSEQDQAKQFSDLHKKLGK